MLLIAARCQTINVLVLSIAEYSEIIDIMLSISICTDVTDIHLDRFYGHNNELRTGINWDRLQRT